MKVGLDIGGVISKYPNQFKSLIKTLVLDEKNEVFIITDQHPKEKVIKTLIENNINEHLNLEECVYCSDYEKYGNLCKAILIKELGIDIFIDDFDGYLQWDSSLGSQPILIKICPDAYKPYWHDDWKCDGEFGRRKYNKCSDRRVL